MTVEIVYEKEDRMDITEPVIKQKYSNGVFQIDNKLKPNVVDNLGIDRYRTIGICGHLHAGKTALIDFLISSSHSEVSRYTDNHILEKERKISIFPTPISIYMTTKKTMKFNLIDFPGHTGCIYDFQNLQIVDSCCIVIDVIEGIQMNAKTALSYCITHAIPFIVVLNKMDRFIVELKLPPQDAFRKIQVVINEINKYIKQLGGTIEHKIDPLKNNLIFSGLLHGFCFSLQSFADMYLMKSKLRLTTNELVSKLWTGFAYKNGQFVHSKEDSSFADFILEPLYKVYGIILGESKDTIKAFISRMGLKVPRSIYKESAKTILIFVMQQWLGDPQPIVDSFSSLPQPSNRLYLESLPNKASLLYKVIEEMSPQGQVVVAVARIYYHEQLMAFGRVLSGTLQRGQRLVVTNNNEEFIEIPQHIYLPFARTLHEINSASVGDFIIIPVSENIRPNSLLVDSSFKTVDCIVPFRINEPKWLYVAIEPRLPSNLAQMLQTVVIITRLYPAIEFKIQDSGEYGLFGPSEFLMDCVLHDLRYLCQFDVRVSDPIAKLRETVLESSKMQCHSISPNLK